MPKKSSGFAMFMFEYKKREERAGRKFPNGLKSVHEDPGCDREWKQLSERERERYKQMGKATDLVTKKKKKTGTGECMDEVEKQRKRELDFQADMNQDIENTVMKGVEMQDLAKRKFFFIHSNWFYTRKYDNGDFEYFPAEFALAEFSLENGVTQVYHEILKDNVMVGYTREAKETSQETHQIPVPNTLECAEGDYSKMCYKVLQLLKPYKVGGKYPPVYTMQKNNAPVKSLLKKLMESIDLCDETVIVYDLEILLSNLCNANSDDNKFPVVMAEHELVKDTFSFIQGLDCDYHKTLDGTSQFCSMSNVKRWAYTICDCCCEQLKIEMIEGIHYPKKVTFDSLSTNPVTTLFNQMSLENQSIKSMTGVSNAHRLAVSGRTEEEELRRRNQKTTITVVKYTSDEAQVQAPIAPNVPSFTPKPLLSHVASNSATEEYQRPLRAPYSKSSIAAIVGETKQHAFHEEDFPSLGVSSGRGRGNRRAMKEQKQSAGRGRGIALS
ncbi:protein maelstrom homolog [Leptopilina heterotoma]|uniref:protein maelstrom homolog n=1 Tax=Leptopilina heterotoma TaxID=63436 RepID=UPI001CA84411|nr:protein maelstrom homolog [Leptopilina heterotoma]